MAGDYRRRACAAESAQQLDGLPPRFGVETGRRLVEQENRWRQYPGAGECDALPFSARQFLRGCRQQMRQACPGDRLGDQTFPSTALDAAGATYDIVTVMGAVYLVQAILLIWPQP